MAEDQWCPGCGTELVLAKPADGPQAEENLSAGVGIKDMRICLAVESRAWRAKGLQPKQLRRLFGQSIVKHHIVRSAMSRDAWMAEHRPDRLDRDGLRRVTAMIANMIRRQYVSLSAKRRAASYGGRAWLDRGE
jgi:hypothetical protein